jgi:ribosomal protein S18 acetylase RimI-like enzyme
MEFRSITPENYEVVRQFLIDAGWEHRVGDPESFRSMMEKTDRTVVAWDEQRVIGFGRALCDGVSNGYISMVAVAPDRRGQGIGRKLVECLIQNDNNLTWVLRAGRGSEGFWKRLGFTNSAIAMERLRGK